MDNKTDNNIENKELFQCTGCGDCCHFREEKKLGVKDEQNYKNYMYKNFGIIYLADLSNITISIFPEEAEILNKIAKERKIKMLIKPKRAIYTKENNLVIMDYFIDHDVCPFFDEKTKRCTVYEYRPLICRSYPLTSTKSYGKCKYKKLKFEEYGEEMEYAKKLESLINKQKSIISEMMKNNELFLENIDEKKFQEIVNSNIKELRIMK